MSTPAVDVDLVARLASLLPAISTSSTSQNASAGPVRYNLPARPAVFFEVFGGSRLDHTDGKLRTFSIQASILGARDHYGDALAFARSVFDALDRSGRWVGESGAIYIDTICEGTGPIPLGLDDDDSPRFSFVVSVMHDSA